jgi:hypothetical protein
MSNVRPAWIKPQGDRVHSPLVKPEIPGRSQYGREPQHGKTSAGGTRIIRHSHPVPGRGAALPQTTSALPRPPPQRRHRLCITPGCWLCTSEPSPQPEAGAGAIGRSPIASVRPSGPARTQGHATRPVTGDEPRLPRPRCPVEKRSSPRPAPRIVTPSHQQQAPLGPPRVARFTAKSIVAAADTGRMRSWQRARQASAPPASALSPNQWAAASCRNHQIRSPPVESTSAAPDLRALS